MMRCKNGGGKISMKKSRRRRRVGGDKWMASEFMRKGSERSE